MLADFHVHSPASPDCIEPAAQTLRAAIERGVSILCFTDHLDLICEDTPGKKNENAIATWENSYSIVAQAREEFGTQIEILHGMELAELTQDPERARICAAIPGVDFILGSVHALPGKLDFYLSQEEFADPAVCRKVAAAYVEEVIRTAELDLADAMAHLGFYNRYMARHGTYVDLLDFEDQMRHLFKVLARNGKGIEINTSGLRQALGVTLPDLSLLKLFRECGGEIVTTGSDAHHAHHAGLDLDRAKALLQEAGFGYMTIFRQRKPEFIKL